MRITSQPATEPSTATARVPSLPTTPANFRSVLTIASEGRAPQVAHGAPDRGNDKKNDHTKTDHADRSVSVPQTQATPLPGSVTSAVTTPFTLGLPAALQSAAPQVPEDAGDSAQKDSPNLSGQSIGPNVLTSPSALFGPATSSTSAGVPQALLGSSVEPSQGALTEPSSPEVVQDSAVPTSPQPAQASMPPTSAADENPEISPSSSNGAGSQSAAIADAAGLSPAVSTDTAPIDGASILIAPASLTSAVAAAGNTEAPPALPVQSAANPAFVQATPIAPPTGSDMTQNISTSNSIGKARTSTVSLNEGNLKQGAVSSKDRSLAADGKGKRKSDDSDTPPSTAPATGTPSDAKPEDASHQSGQGDSNQQPPQHPAGSEVMLQQALQASVSVTSATSHTAPQSVDSTQVSNAAPPPSQSITTSNGEVAASTAVNSAQLIQSIHQSDMRLGMHSPDFGAISIDTSLTHQALSAQISTDHTELGRALAMHLPSIEEKLGNAYGIHARVEVRDTSTASYGNSSQQQSQSQQAKGNHQGQTQGGPFVPGTPSMLATMTALTSSTASVASSDARLDIRI